MQDVRAWLTVALAGENEREPCPNNLMWVVDVSPL